MPNSFRYYHLPAIGVPVFHGEEQITTVDIPESGPFILELDEEHCKSLTMGKAIIRVHSVVVIKSGQEPAGLEVTKLDIETV